MTAHSEEINEIATALAKAQESMTVAEKDGKNPHFKSAYSTLASVINAVRPMLSKQGIAVFQDVGTTSEGVQVTTRFIHSSGQWLSSTIAAKPQKPDAQGIGSCVTYLRRYGLMAAAGIAPGDDDDGSAAAGLVESKVNTRQAQKPPPQQNSPEAFWLKRFASGDSEQLDVSVLCKIKDRGEIDPDRAAKGIAAALRAARGEDDLNRLNIANTVALNLIEEKNADLASALREDISAAIEAAGKKAA